MKSDRELADECRSGSAGEARLLFDVEEASGVETPRGRMRTPSRPLTRSASRFSPRKPTWQMGSGSASCGPGEGEGAA